MAEFLRIRYLEKNAMNMLTWLDESFSLRFVITLLHFLWQGVTVALVVMLAGWLLKRAAAQVRYAIGVVAMLGMVACLPITFALVDVRGPDAEADKTRTPMALRFNELNQPHGDAPVAKDVFAADEPPLATHASSYKTSPTETVAPTPANAEPALTWFISAAPYLTTIYLAGVVLMVLRLATGLWGGQRLRRASTPVDDDTLLAMVKRQSQRIGLKVAPAIAFCEQISIPVVVGVVKPMILLPAALASGLSPDQLQALLTHELAHIRRYDSLVNLLQRLIESFFFFHPAVWYVSRRVNIERENAADDMVLAAGWRSANYADALVRMAELSSALRNSRFENQAALLAASGTNVSDFKRRVLRLLDTSEVPRLRLKRGGMLMLFLVVASLLVTPLLLGQVIKQPDAGGDGATSGDLRSGDGRGRETRAQRAETRAQRASGGLRASRTIRGRLIDERAEPVSDALIWFTVKEQWEHTYEGPPVVAHARSEADGSFSLKPPSEKMDQFVKSPSTQFQIWVQKAGFALTRYVHRGAMPPEAVEIGMSPEPSVEFRIRNADGTPCSGAAVTLISARFPKDSYVVIPEAIREHLVTRTDDDGRVQVVGLKHKEIVTLEFAKMDLGRQGYSFYARGRRMPTDLKLRNVGALNGQLVFPKGSKADPSRVKVRIVTMNTTEHGEDEYWHGESKVQLDRRGRFSIPRIAEGTVRVFIDEPDEFAFRSDPPAEGLVVKPDKTARLEIPMRKTVKVTRLLLDRNTKKPIRGVRVLMQNRHQHIYARTDDDGRFTARILPDVRYHTVYNLPSGYINLNRESMFETFVPGGAADHVLDPIEFLRGRTIEGTVVDSSGRPLVGVQVAANWDAPDEDFGIGVAMVAVQGRRWATTDSAGRFRLDRIHPDVDVTLTPVRAQVVLGKSQLAPKNDTPVRLETNAFKFISLSGRVVDLDGNPIAGAEYLIYLIRSSKQYHSFRGVTDGDGLFETPAHFPTKFEYKLAVQSQWNDVVASPALAPAQSGSQFSDVKVDRSKLVLRDIFPESKRDRSGKDLPK